jgi:hypothetical protein
MPTVRPVKYPRKKQTVAVAQEKNTAYTPLHVGVLVAANVLEGKKGKESWVLGHVLDSKDKVVPPEHILVKVSTANFSASLHYTTFTLRIALLVLQRKHAIALSCT